MSRRPSKKTNFSDSQPASPLLVGDGYENVVANLGTGRDKAAGGFYAVKHLSSYDYASMYRSTWLASAIVDYPAEDATRNWRKWHGDKDQITNIENIEKRLSIKSKTKEAIIAARLFGGAVIYINTNSKDQVSPIKHTEEIVSLIVLNKDQVEPGQIVRDIRSRYYGKPEHYTISSDSAQVEIHASRFAIFRGADLPAGVTTENGLCWGDSVLQSTLDAIESTDSTMANIASLVFEAKIDVLKFKGLTQMLADKSKQGDQTVIKRLTNQMVMKGINGTLVIDGEDQYDQKSANFSGLPDVARLFMDAVAGAARIPVTRLYGRSAVGLSGSGDGDERVYFDRVKDMQSDDISSALYHIDECLINNSLKSRPANIFYEWSPLRQKTESDIIDILGKLATAARTLAGTTAGEIIPLDALSDAVSNALIESGSLPGLEQALEKFGGLAGQRLQQGGEEE